MSDVDSARTLMGAAERDLRALRGMSDATVFLITLESKLHLV